MSETPPLDAVSVLRACGAWLHVPEGAPTLDTEDYLVVRLPPHYPYPVELVRFTPRRPVEQVVPEALARAVTFGEPELLWRLRLDSPPEVEPLLLARGGVLEEALEVLALDLARPLPDLSAPEVDLRWVTDVVTARDSFALAVAAFGGAAPEEAEVYRAAARGAIGQRVGRGGSLVAYVDGRPVATAGLSVEGMSAGLWGGAVLEPFRGQGIYRALLAARLEYAVEHELRLALVRARVDTSAPVLRRAGFTGYGEERSYRVPL